MISLPEINFSGNLISANPSINFFDPRIWIASFPDTAKYHSLLVRNDENIFPTDYPKTITYYPINSAGQFYIMNGDAIASLPLGAYVEPSGERFIDIAVDNHQGLWAVNYSGLLEWLGGNTFHRFVIGGIPYGPLKKIVIGDRNQVWGTGLKTYFTYTALEEEIPLISYDGNLWRLVLGPPHAEHRSPYSLTVDQQGSVWTGGHAYSSAQYRFPWINPTPPVENEHRGINIVYNTDRALVQKTVKEGLFDSILFTTSMDVSPHNNVVAALYGYDYNTGACNRDIRYSHGGILRFPASLWDSRSGTFDYTGFTAGGYRPFLSPEPPEECTFQAHYLVKADWAENIWAVTKDQKKIYVMDSTGVDISFQFHLAEILTPSALIFDIRPLPDSSVVIAANTGIFVYFPDRSYYQNNLPRPVYFWKSALSGYAVNSLDYDTTLALWAGTQENGLFYLKPITPETGDSAFVDSVALGLREKTVNFTEKNSNLLSNTVYSVGVHRATGTVWAATSRGINKYLSGSVTQVSDLKKLSIPSLVLRGMNGQIVFNQIPRFSTIKIYSLSGQMLRYLSAGSTNQNVWDGRNQHGQPVGGGIYLYVVINNSEKRTGKIAVIR
jgi:hypothetical protein